MSAGVGSVKEGDKLSWIQGGGKPGKAPTRMAVAAALVCGFRLKAGHELRYWREIIDGAAVSKHFWLFDASAKATFKPIESAEMLSFNQFVERIESEDWCKANADHPIAYMRELFVQLEDMAAKLKDLKPLDRYRNGSAFADISPYDSPEDQQYFKDKLAES